MKIELLKVQKFSIENMLKFFKIYLPIKLRCTAVPALPPAILFWRSIMQDSKYQNCT